jgi:hypothetical protein
MIFYGDFSAFRLSISLIKCKIQFKIAPTLDGSKKSRGKVTSGEKIYAWEDQTKCAFFSLLPTECVHIFSVFDQIYNRTYIDVNNKDEKYKHIFSLVHFIEKKPSRLNISGNDKGGLNISITNPGKQMVSFVLRNYEVPIFKSFINKGFSELPWYSELEKANEAKKSKERYDEAQKQSQSINIQPQGSIYG